MTPPELPFDPAAVASLLALASAAADGEPVGLLDTEGHLLAGRSPGAVPAHAAPVTQGSGTVASAVGSAGVRPELLVLVARSLELAIAGADARAARERVEQELAIGRRIQLSLVPRRFPDVAGWTFAAAYEPAREVGGDLFDAFPVRGRPGHVGLLVADVTGKGIAAALMMADVRALLHAATDNAGGPAEALARVNRILVRERATSLMVTAVLLVLDTATGTLRYAGAGHEPPLVARCAGGIDELEAGGTILGLQDDVRFEDREAVLEPGDALVLYTDGITEARDEGRRFYGEARLHAVVGDTCGRPAEIIMRAISDDVRAFRGAAEPYDDLTLLVVERRRGV